MASETALISRTGLHAVRALKYLVTHGNGEYLGARLIAEEVEAPANYLSKLLQMLSKQGLLVSRKGQGGGFRLAKRPEQISLLDVLDPIDALSSRSECFLGYPECGSAAACPVHDKYAAVRDAFIGFLADTSLAETVDHKELIDSLIAQ